MRTVRLTSLATAAIAAAAVFASSAAAQSGPPGSAKATAELEAELKAVGARDRSPQRPLGVAPTARGFAHVPGIGTARRLAGGNYLLRNKGGELSMTHGGDPVAAPGAHYPLPAGIGDIPHCVQGVDKNSIVVLYGRHSSSPYRRDEFYPTINNALHRMNQSVRNAALASGGPPAEIKTPCYDDNQSVRLPAFVNSGGNDFQSIKNAAAAAGFCSGQAHCYGTGPRKYLIFYDHGQYPDLGGGRLAAGLGECWCMNNIGAWRRDQSNWNLTTPSMYAVVWRGRTDGGAGTWHLQTTLHEMFHTLGAVNHAAPHATQASHCADGIDVMCYDDGGMYPGQYYHEGTCPSTNPVAIDCRQDAYFDTAPVPETWNAWYYQLGWSGNNFFQFG